MHFHLADHADKEIERERESFCLNLIVYLLSCGCKGSVSLPRGVAWSVIVAFPDHTHLLSEFWTIFL